MVLAIDLAAQGRALKRPAAEIEGEGRQGIEPPVAERRRDQSQNSPLGSGDVASQQGFGVVLGDGRGGGGNRLAVEAADGAETELR